MSNANSENTKKIKPLSNEDTQPAKIDESWLKPVPDDDATIPLPAARNRKPRVSVPQPLADEGVTIPVSTARKVKSQVITPQPIPDNSETIPVSRRKKSEQQPTPPPPPIAALDAGSAAENSAPPLEAGTGLQTLTIDDAETPAGLEPPAGKSKRGRWIWLGILGMLIIMLLGAGVGYASAIRARMIEGENQRLITATTQFELGLVDQREGRFETAQKRFEYVLSIYPEFPGIADKLVEVGLVLAETQGGPVVAPPAEDGQPDTVITPVPTKDTTSVSILFNQAQNQLKAKDWEGLYTTLDKMRYIDPEYESVKADGMLYLALRNRGIAQVQAGHLEPGLYSFALASQIAPIDTDAEGYFTWAARYLKAASYGLVDEFLDDAVAQFAELYSLVPNLRDASGISVAQRYAQSLVYLGDYYQRMTDYCGALPYYQQATGIYALNVLAEKIPQAEEYCKNPPEVSAPTPEPPAPAATQAITVVPTTAVQPTAEPTLEPTVESTPSPTVGP